MSMTDELQYEDRVEARTRQLIRIGAHTCEECGCLEEEDLCEECRFKKEPHIDKTLLKIGYARCECEGIVDLLVPEQQKYMLCGSCLSGLQVS